MDGGFSSTIVMRIIVEIFSLEKDDVIQRHTQTGNITINLKVKVDFTLTRLSEMNVVTYN